MATTYSIHPAIGIARLGNSPSEFFVGPERLRERPMPGTFKDAQLRVKRQAARFRIFAHHDDGSTQEITAAQAEITWTVHVANKKAAFPGRGNDEPAGDLTIDPGSRSASGPNQRQVFDTGRIQFAGQAPVTVPLGELRTDEQNRLLVLGAFGTAASPANNGMDDFWGNYGWYDDIADGPVRATIKLHATGETPAVEGAWVIVAPPKFAPHQDSVTTLYDRLQQTFIDVELLPVPATTSYTHDVYPILQRTRDIRWVYSNGRSNWDTKHAWAHPVTDIPTRQAIFARLRPESNMPLLAGSDSELTGTQRAHLERWKNDTSFVNDWVGAPEPEASITPAGLDRAALEACVGGAFYPGIEAGGRYEGERPITTPANYAKPFRLNHAVVAPGDISASMALPWHADFLACGETWWPVPRPNSVIPEGASEYRRWDSTIGDYAAMVAKWHTLGFVVQRGERHVEVEVTPAPSISLLTPFLSFSDVPQGPLGMVRERALAIEFEVSSDVEVTLEYTRSGAPSHPQLLAATPSVTLAPGAPGAVQLARLWIVYSTGDAPSAIPAQVVELHNPATGERWSVEIEANTVARAQSAVALVLDRSASMAENRGDGQSKHASLQAAAEVFVDVMIEDDAVGLVRYNADAQPVQALTTLGKGGLNDAQRKRVVDVLRGDSLSPLGTTSIGDGLFEGRKLLDSASDAFVSKRMIVVSDGKENRERFIADVAPEIDAETYAVGLGRPQNTSAVALQTLADNRGGYLLSTGRVSVFDKFELQNDCLEILASLNDSDVLLARKGLLVESATQRIPFVVSDADAGIDVIVMSDQPSAIDFRLQTPGGRILEPWRADAEPTMRFVHSKYCSYFRLSLPTQLMPGRFDREGTWHVLLKLGKLQLARSKDSEPGTDRSIVQGLHAPARAVPARAATLVLDERVRRFAVARHAAANESQPVAAGGLRRRASYALRVHAYSSVSLQADVEQASHEPGASMSLTASLSQAGLPLLKDAAVTVELTGPRGDKSTHALEDLGDGQFALQLAAAKSGVHALRIEARGRTRNGVPFVRERLRSAVVWRGADAERAPDAADLQELSLSSAADDGVELERLASVQRSRKQAER